MEAPTHLTVEGKTHKITPAQWSLLVRATFNKFNPGHEVGKPAVVAQLVKKGFCSKPSSVDNYQRYEWGRPVGGSTLHACNLFPAVQDAVRALVAERRAASVGGAL